MAKKRDLLQKALVIAKRQGRNSVNTVKKFPAQNKLGLGISATSLGLSSINFVDNKKRTKREQDKLDLEAKSLTALNKIHKALEKKDES